MLFIQIPPNKTVNSSYHAKKNLQYYFVDNSSQYASPVFAANRPRTRRKNNIFTSKKCKLMRGIILLATEEKWKMSGISSTS